MFEIIGLAIGTAAFFALAVCVGSAFAFCAWLIAPKRLGRTLVISTAFLIPLLSAAYLWLCVALLPGESLFGDIEEPLPNGYVLKALGKMPEYGMIVRENGDLSSDGVRGRVDQIAVNGPLVAGRYCQACAPAFVQSKAWYFVLDTRTSQSSEFNDLKSVEAAFHSSKPLIENQFFRSRERQHLLQERIDEWIMFAPPLGMAIIYFASLICYRIRESSRSQT